MPQFAQLSENDLQKVKDLEKKLGVTVLAYQKSEPAQLSTPQLDELQRLEKSTRSTLVAYKKE